MAYLVNITCRAERDLANLYEQEFRHLLLGSKPHIYRVIYRVVEKQKYVEVLHVRHGARRGFRPVDLV